MRLPQAAQQYSAVNEAQARSALEQADQQNHKRGRDIEIGPRCRAIFTDTATGARYALTVAGGVLTLTAL